MDKINTADLVAAPGNQIVNISIGGKAASSGQRQDFLTLGPTFTSRSKLRPHGLCNVGVLKLFSLLENASGDIQAAVESALGQNNVSGLSMFFETLAEVHMNCGNDHEDTPSLEKVMYSLCIGSSPH